MADMQWLQTHRQMELFPTPAEEKAAPVRQPVSDDDAVELLQAIQAGHDTLDKLCPVLGKGAHTITPLLMRLQIERRIIPLPGGRFSTGV